MKFDFQNFRNLCAETGVEMTPDEAKPLYDNYEEFLKSIKEAYELIPNFYEVVTSRTTEQKLQDIEDLKNERGVEMTLKDYNELQGMLKRICKLEGYDE